jgi:hypothetical protein
MSLPATAAAAPAPPAARRPRGLPAALSRPPWLLRLTIPALVFSAFLTDVRFVPALTNNVGLFELIGGGLILLTLITAVAGAHRLRLHPILRVVGLIVFAAALSQLNLPASHFSAGLIELAILAFPFAFLVALANLLQRYSISPTALLRWIGYSVLIVGPWVILEGVETGGSIGAAGPFRNRAHLGTYMLTAFWLSVILALWPGLKKRDRLVSWAAICLTLYGVAVSGRRSVYLSLLFGLAGLVVAMAIAHRGKRLRLFAAAGLALGFLSLFYFAGGAVFPRAAFFQERLWMVGDALRDAFAPVHTVSVGDENFVALQRKGVLQAFNEHPLFGIGWGGFWESRYSPTGHEVHSTPLRFLAELGLVGVALYGTFVILLLTTTARLSALMRRSPYGASYLALAVALWSLCVSYTYNRHLTERTFWLLLAVLFTLEAFARRWRAAQARAAAGPPSPGGPPALAAPKR